MSDRAYGFQALAHRHKVLGGIPVDIPDGKLIDLSRLLYTIYGARYIGHPRLAKLVEKNHMTHKDMLSGAEEAAAFEQKEYVKLHMSTLRKVDTFETIAERTYSNTLKTNITWRDSFRDYPEALGEILKEHWVVSIIGFVSAIAGIVALFLAK